jgi:hypothetical protein
MWLMLQSKAAEAFLDLERNIDCIYKNSCLIDGGDSDFFVFKNQLAAEASFLVDRQTYCQRPNWHSEKNLAGTKKGLMHNLLAFEQYDF